MVTDIIKIISSITAGYIVAFIIYKNRENALKNKNEKLSSDNSKISKENHSLKEKLGNSKKELKNAKEYLRRIDREFEEFIELFKDNLHKAKTKYGNNFSIFDESYEKTELLRDLIDRSIEEEV